MSSMLVTDAGDEIYCRQSIFFDEEISTDLAFVRTQKLPGQKYMRQKRGRPCIPRMMKNQMKINKNSHQIRITA